MWGPAPVSDDLSDEAPRAKSEARRAESEAGLTESADQQAATLVRRIAARVRDDGGQRFPVDPDVRQPQ